MVLTQATYRPPRRWKLLMSKNLNRGISLGKRYRSYHGRMNWLGRCGHDNGGSRSLTGVNNPQVGGIINALDLPVTSTNTNQVGRSLTYKLDVRAPTRAS